MMRKHVNMINKGEEVYPLTKNEIRTLKEFLIDNLIYNYVIIENCLEFKIGRQPFIIVKKYNKEEDCIEYREYMASPKSKTYKLNTINEFLRFLKIEISNIMRTGDIRCQRR